MMGELERRQTQQLFHDMVSSWWMMDNFYIYIYNYKSSEFKQTPNYKLQNHLWAHTLKKKTKPQIKQQKQKKKEEDRKTSCCITDTFVLVTE